MLTPDGTPIWFELTTADQDRAQTFYQDVAGWTVATAPGQELARLIHACEAEAA